ncbi:uncharacterized protein LOC126788850 [Argentina anserina]|uniref:uncharacterized protein LOC126785650 n=1 Tax=Argentina anserina TaxID=57926 RepID=UPI0021768EAD|nr:uncharacterized protein LOC126785650 [Potentilla anserina]XP_050367219.1 uncharacterized protein LOC126785651 [Potentilla anserina]XP_050370817.1 uncharacterized protein LOC126788850 [Potentilla anserina]
MKILPHPRVPTIITESVSEVVREFLLGPVHLSRGGKDTAATILSQTERPVKICDPRTEETEEILIEPINPAVESQTCGIVEKPKVSNYTHYCLICDDNCDHSTGTCPDRTGKFVTLCSRCDFLPCKNEGDHKEQYLYEQLLFCSDCNTVGDHYIHPDIDSDMGDDGWNCELDDVDWDDTGDRPDQNAVKGAAAA